METDLISASSLRAVMCNLCGAREDEKLRAIENSWLVRCRHCELIYINPQPVPEQLENFYRADYFTHSDGLTYGYCDYVSDKSSIVRTFKFRYKLISRFRKPGKLLDVGCAYGFSLIAAQECGWQAKGLEIAPDVAGQARELFGVDVEQGTLTQVVQKGEQFDLVTLWDVIEHLADPYALMREAYLALKPGGLLVLMTPNVGSLISKLSGTKWVLYERGAIEHLYYFTPKTIAKMLERAGFKIIRSKQWGWGGKFVDMEFVLSRLVHYAPFPFKQLRWLIEKLRMNKWAFYADIGDNMVVIAQKPELSNE